MRIDAPQNRPVIGRARRASALRRAFGRTRAALDPSAAADKPDEAFETRWRAGLRRRVAIVLGVLALWAVGIEARLIRLQVFQHDELVARAIDQQQDLVTTPALRGDITDRNGRLLAYSVDGSAILIFPKRVSPAGPEGIAAAVAALCAELGDCTPAERSDLAERLTGKRPFYARRARNVSVAQAARLKGKEKALPYVQLMSEEVRFYPGLDLGAHVVGFVNTDNAGLAGVEEVYDTAIKGRSGTMFVQVDGSGRSVQTRVEREATAGATVELTIDGYLQHVVERELKAGIEQHRAEGGTAIVVDPNNGEILALASYPTFNPNRYARASVDARRNRAVQDVYEPGSTFKIVTAAAAIEGGVLTPSDLVDCGPGILRIGSRIIDEAKGHNYGVLSFADVIVKSSNVGAAKAGIQVGRQRLSEYVQRFGFGQILTRDFNGQSRGRVYGVSDLDASAIASVSMGYQISVTPLQMAMAASAVANGGLLFEPHLVRAFAREDERAPVAAKTVRRVITQETAATLTLIMEDVVIRGTAKQAALERHPVAGKTGTAAKIVNGRYSETDYNASFVGFVPSRRPAFTILVVVDTPHSGKTYGGDVAAPIFKRIAEAAVLHAGLAPTIGGSSAVVMAAAPVFAQQPAARPAVIPVVAEVGGSGLVPDVRGLGAREALRILSRAGLYVRVSGEGSVVTQSPAPGTPIAPGGWSLLQLKREAPAIVEPRDSGERR